MISSRPQVKDLASKVRTQFVEQEQNIERRIKAGVEKALHTINLPTRGDLDELRTRLNRMESRLDGLLSNGHGKKKSVKVKTK